MVDRLGTRFRADLTDPAIYSHWHRDVLRFGDLDPQEHVGHVNYGFIFQNARLAYWSTVGLEGADPAEGLIVVRLCMDYLADLRFPGAVRTGTRVLHVGTTSITVGAAMYDEDWTCVAIAEAVSVRSDPTSGKPRAWSQRQRAALEAACFDLELIR